MTMQGARDANESRRYYREERWREAVLELLRKIEANTRRGITFDPPAPAEGRKE